MYKLRSTKRLRTVRRWLTRVPRTPRIAPLVRNAAAQRSPLLPSTRPTIVRSLRHYGQYSAVYDRVHVRRLCNRAIGRSVLFSQLSRSSACVHADCRVTTLSSGVFSSCSRHRLYSSLFTDIGRGLPSGSNERLTIAFIGFWIQTFFNTAVFVFVNM